MKIVTLADEEEIYQTSSPGYGHILVSSDVYWGHISGRRGRDVAADLEGSCWSKQEPLLLLLIQTLHAGSSAAHHHHHHRFVFTQSAVSLHVVGWNQQTAESWCLTQLPTGLKVLEVFILLLRVHEDLRELQDQSALIINNRERGLIINLCGWSWAGEAVTIRWFERAHSVSQQLMSIRCWWGNVCFFNPTNVWT